MPDQQDQGRLLKFEPFNPSPCLDRGKGEDISKRQNCRQRLYTGRASSTYPLKIVNGSEPQ